MTFQPQRGFIRKGRYRIHGHNAFGVESFRYSTQGSSFLATLG